MQPGLGTQLRHLVDLLDSDVALAYRDAGLQYRPRYTPVMRVLELHGAATIGQIAQFAGITQPAATQTVGLMNREGLVTVRSGPDARQRLVSLSRRGKSMLSDVRSCLAATTQAAAELDAELAFPLSQCLANAIQALEARPFGARIRAARSRLDAAAGTAPFPARVTVPRTPSTKRRTP